MVDATQDLLVNVLPYHPFLIKPNNHELGEIVGRMLTTDEEIIAAARTLQQKGARNVLVSMAGDGCLLYTSPQSPACSATILPRRSWVPKVWRWMPVLPRRTPRKLP